MHCLLSHVLDVAAPSYPGEPGLVSVPRHRIAQGDDCNTAMLTLFNHFGTHMDAPRHYVDHGTPIAELPLSRFIHDAPVLIDLPMGCGSLIEPDDLEPFEARIRKADMLLVRTGIEPLRRTDPDRYAAEGPAFSTAAARYLNATFPKLKTLGFDFISLGSPANALHAAPAHHALLGVNSDHFTCIIEDMALAEAPAVLARVIALPLFVRGLDSAPVTVLAEYADPENADERPSRSR